MKRSKLLRLVVVGKTKTAHRMEHQGKTDVVWVSMSVCIASPPHQFERSPYQHLDYTWEMGCDPSQTTTPKLWDSFITTRTCLPHFSDNHSHWLKISM